MIGIRERRVIPSAVHPDSGRPGRQSGRVAIVLALVVGVDQLSKWWAWRHTAWPLVNIGGNFLIGTTVSGWLSYPRLGAGLDLVGAVLLGLGVTVLARRRRRPATSVAGALFLAGWISNLLDRLGLHEWTAPGSARGVVDFIFVGTQTFNVADLAIVGGTVGLLVTAAVAVARAWAAPLDAATLVENAEPAPASR